MYICKEIKRRIMTRIFSGHIIDIVNKKIIDGELTIKDNKVYSISEKEGISADAPYIMAGFIDSHIHIESSMLLPRNFATQVVKFGTIGVVSDPHEIANVLGMQGIEYMIQDGKNVNFHFYNGTPSCVPATSFETSGAILNSEDVDKFLGNEDIYFLSEMMNYPGVLFKDKEVMQKISSAIKHKKPIDGHAPSVVGEDIKEYSSYGITTDHECSEIKEALEKINYGIKILIREGSAAKNFDNLLPLISSHPKDIMFCSDDKHPDDLLLGHINLLVKRALLAGYNLFDVLRATSLNPKEHYNLDFGLLQEGDNADFIIVDNLQDFNVLSTYINGVEVYNRKTGVNKELVLNELDTKVLPNKFNATYLSEEDIKVKSEQTKINVIECFDGELFTKSVQCEAKVENNYVTSDTSKDILKIVVLNRYENTKPQVAFIKGFGFKQGAIASSVSHDSHNIVAVGVSDKEIVEAINLVVENKGGISLVCNTEKDVLPLQIAGLMSKENCEIVAEKYKELNSKAKNLSNSLQSPYMTLSFMALLVIPELKLSDKGLFDSKNFKFTELFVK